MKKLLTILGSVGLIATTSAAVIACGDKTPSAKQPTNSNEKPSNNGDSSNPSESDKDKKPGNTKPSESDSNRSTTPVDPKKPNESGSKPTTKTDKSNNDQTTPIKPKLATISWNSIFRDSATGADINLNPTKEQIEAENKKQEEIIKKELDKNKEYNISFHKQNIDVLKNEIIDLRSNRFVIAKESNKKEKELEDLKEANIRKTTKDFETNKNILDKKKQENDHKLNYLIKEVFQKQNLKAKSEQAKKELEDLKDWLKEANELVNEYTTKEKEYTDQVTKAKELDTNITKTESEIQTNKKLAESIEKITEDIKKVEDQYNKEITEKQNWIKELDDDDKELKKRKEELTNSYDEFDSFIYNGRLENAFRHEIISSLDEFIKNNNETRDEIRKIEADLNKLKESTIEKLTKDKNQAEKAKNDLSSLESSLNKMKTEKEEIDKHLHLINDQVSKDKKHLTEYKKNVGLLEEEIEQATKSESYWTKTLKEYEADLNKLLSEKSEIENLLNMLTKTLEDSILKTELTFEKETEELDKQAFEKEDKIDKQILELENIIKKIEEFISQFQK
ncbi:MAG6090-like repeat-containing lipoprotein [Mycoplasma mycoides]|uniref:Lipoprotein n=1 Tax=Mycoplasma mycoides subsp. capri TaxID=40477 RepID=A0AB38GDM6_MYCMC|nr:lipoprotein [Mycoplasma mycoides]ADH21515.1 putative liporotein [synthetic Mycoplasma mycoides JCVI-syn1.0]ACU78242.1 putative liporotein [Mycoplasma mycoides subsp. capri str. GM12]ACU79072.1 putative liporotein [Mycoplasma mycoides subsp. capri str. GM12]SRX60878.1 lipoprotein [Mycoplasma mycoides subsp. capri]SRX61107.1 lipoprotein [Mycoplasma mycoides subsp. capri]